MSRALRVHPCILRRWTWALAGAGVPLTLAQAAVAVPDEMLASVRRGEALTLIVEIDATSIDAAASARRARLPRQIDNAAALQALAASYRARKAQLLQPLAQRNDIEAGPDYSHLPMLVRRVRSEAALRALAALPGVRALHAERLHQPVLAQSLPLIAQPPVAAVGLQGNGSTVAVIDDGLALNNPAFGGCTAVGVPASCRVAATATFVNGARTDPATNNEHGTNVAAIVLGAAPQARVAAVNVFNTTGSASSSDIISGINWAIANRAAYNIVAINMSLGDASRNATPCTTGSYITPVTNARNAGIHVIASAGNAAYVNGVFTPGLASPACTAGVVSVGAVYDSGVGGLIWSGGTAAQCTDNSTAADQVTCFSMSASYLSLLAPGALILAGGISKGGTSQAAPHVAGALAVLRAGFATDTLAAIEARLRDNGVGVTDPRSGQVTPRLDLRAAARPVNDDFADALAITGASGSTQVSSLLATLEPGEPQPAPQTTQSLWWRWTAPAAGQVSLNTVGSSYDTRLDVYTGAGLGALAAVAGNDNADATTTRSALRFQAAAGTTYRWAVASSDGNAGNASLAWSLNTAAQANLSVGLAGPASAAVGATLAYTLTLANAGPESATGVRATVTLPTGLSVVSLPSGCALLGATITCTAGELANGASLDYTLTLRVDSLAAPVSLSASLSSDLPDSILANNSAALALAPGGDDSADIPTLPEWALMLLGGLLVWVAGRLPPSPTLRPGA